MPGLLSTAQLANITATTAKSLDQSLPLSRNTTLGTSDGAGHASETWVAQGNVTCNVSKASASVLQEYAGIIGSKRAVTLRATQTTDIREGDRVTYDGLTWVVQERLNANSYSVVNRFLMTEVG